MEKENKKLKNALYKKEKLRINRMVNLAYENDPRIIKMIEEEERIKEEKREAKRKLKEEKKQKELDRKRKIKEEAERVKREKEEKIKSDKMRKQKLKQEREDLEKKVSELFLNTLKKGKFDKFYLEGAFSKLTPENLTEAKSKLENKDFKEAEDFDNFIKNLVEARMKKNKEEYNMIKKKEPKKKATEWTKADLSLLSKGLIKFPAGTPSRWERIVHYMNNKFTEQEIADKVKKLKENPINKSKKKKNNGYDVNLNNNVEKVDPLKWSQVQQKQLEKALKTIPSKLPPKERWTKIAELVDDKSMSDCVKRFKEIKEKMKKRAKKN